MTTFRDKFTSAASAFVWLWLPKARTPIVVGKLEENGKHHDFYYGQSYLENAQAFSLFENELPLIGKKRFTSQRIIHDVMRDSMPDAWGQRILQLRYPNKILTPLDLLLLSGSDRIGALHFQTSPQEYIAKEENNVTLEQLVYAAKLIESGKPISAELDIAINHGTSIGGARPKATLEDENKKFIAKFSSSMDVFPIVQAEFAVMSLAKKVGLNVANVHLKKVNGKYVLLVERFDREKIRNSWCRKMMLSALTLLNLDEMEARYASYLDLADIIKKNGGLPTQQLRELFSRMVFNIMVGNTDDHAKNHSFFWDGKNYNLTPAYDVCPYPRAGQEATQAMAVGTQGSLSQLSNAQSSATRFNLSDPEAQQITEKMLEQIKKFWPQVCEEAELTHLQQKMFTHTAILNPYIFL